MSLHVIATPWGVCQARISPTGVQALAPPGAVLKNADADESAHAATDELAHLLAQELADYFGGRLRRFRTPLDLSGHTPFRLRVWEAMVAIPFGETVRYGEIAARIGCASARAVGQACGANPVPLLVPCHRVVGSGRGVGGWSGPAGMKERLLAHERSVVHGGC